MKITTCVVFRQAECTKRLFHHISAGRENLTEQDVKKFAQANGLPVDYVKPFFSSLSSYSRFGQSASKEVPYEVFHRYVVARETALKRIFDKLDASASSSLSISYILVNLWSLFPLDTALCLSI